ncbi:MAG: SBBP repeat-containing protein [Bacteroidota bacterium]|nr:SBBP repeat-containing protein [Bacteroidota bacterium]
MKTKYLFIAFLFFSDIISASEVKQPVHSQFGFIENKGQIIDQDNKPNPACLFLYNGSGLHVQLKQNSFSYEVWQNTKRRAESDASTKPVLSGVVGLGVTNDTSYIHRVDVSFLNANKNPIIVASDIASDYLNYYTTSTPETGVTHVRHFKKVLYQNIYPHIDVEFILNDQQQNGSPIANGFKYNFIIHPGGNHQVIQIKFDGATNASLNAEGNILIETAYGNIEESIPESYQTDNDNSKLKVAASYYTFQASPFTFGISVGNYDASKTLVIDPWATYYGGSGYDYGRGIAFDSIGNVVSIGYSTSTSGIATSGAYQTSKGGGGDAFIVKFNASGARQWATYYGGSGDEYGQGIAVDGGGNIVITGHTYSTSGIATSGAHQTSNGGNGDAFIAKFNASGARQWATYYGGSWTDWGYGIAVDGSGNIAITGYTYSTSGIATSGAYQTSFAGTYDAFIAKFNASGARQWATYYGGGGNESGNGIAVDSSGSIVITGKTESTSGIATSGAYQTSYGGGGWDAFIAKFNASGARQWATYYGGSGYDFGYGIAADGSGNIVITGNTASTSGIATSGAYQSSFGGGNDAFIAKFNASGVRGWATYCGGSVSEYGYGIAVDNNGNIAITGYTSSTYGFATSGAYQTSYGGNDDALIAKFNASGARQWATYYGGSEFDYGYGIAADGSGNIVITGNTASTSGIATSGAYQTSYGGGFYDAFVASFTPSGGLPVKLISFNAKLLSNKEVLLSWQTASETNNDFFEVERRVNPELPGTPGTTGTSEDNWDIVGKVKGAGNSNLLRSYKFVDDIKTYAQSWPLSPLSHITLYYRLKQVDYDGSFSYSNVVTVKLDKALQNEPIIFPNPGNGNFSISTNQFILELELFDPKGQSLLKMFDVSGTQQIHLSNDVKAGIYFLKIITDDGIVVKKIEVLR